MADNGRFSPPFLFCRHRRSPFFFYFFLASRSISSSFLRAGSETTLSSLSPPLFLCSPPIQRPSRPLIFFLLASCWLCFVFSSFGRGRRRCSGGPFFLCYGTRAARIYFFLFVYLGPPPFFFSQEREERNAAMAVFFFFFSGGRPIATIGYPFPSDNPCQAFSLSFSLPLLLLQLFVTSGTFFFLSTLLCRSWSSISRPPSLCIPSCISFSQPPALLFLFKPDKSDVPGSPFFFPLFVFGPMSDRYLTSHFFLLNYPVRSSFFFFFANDSEKYISFLPFVFSFYFASPSCYDQQGKGMVVPPLSLSFFFLLIELRPSFLPLLSL